MNTQELAKNEPEAFAALPEAYQNDDVLFFYYDGNNNLIAEPQVRQRFALGVWDSVFDRQTKTWQNIYRQR